MLILIEKNRSLRVTSLLMVLKQLCIISTMQIAFSFLVQKWCQVLFKLLFKVPEHSVTFTVFDNVS